MAWSLSVNHVLAARIIHNLLRICGNVWSAEFFTEVSPFCCYIEIVPQALSVVESVSGLRDHTDTTQNGNHASLHISQSFLLRNNSIMIIMDISWEFTTGNDLFYLSCFIRWGNVFFFPFRPLARYVIEILYRLRNDVCPLNRQHARCTLRV